MSQMKSGQYVYGGPNTTTYAAIGYVEPNKMVTAKWREGAFLCIEYSEGGGSPSKRGYVTESTVSLSESITAKTITLSPRRILSNTMSYQGPTASYETNGQLPRGTYVDSLFVEQTLTLIEYGHSATQKVRAYVSGNALTIAGTAPTENSSVTAFPNSYYASPNNPSTVGQCVWYCRGRDMEVRNNTSSSLPSGNANEWYGRATNLVRRMYPVNNSIACSNHSSYGHVWYVEYVDRDFVYITEANWNAGTDGKVKKLSIANFFSRCNGAFQGCIVP